MAAALRRCAACRLREGMPVLNLFWSWRSLQASNTGSDCSRSWRSPTSSGGGRWVLTQECGPPIGRPLIRRPGRTSWLGQPCRDPLHKVGVHKVGVHKFVRWAQPQHTRPPLGTATWIAADCVSHCCREQLCSLQPSHRRHQGFLRRLGFCRGYLGGWLTGSRAPH